MVSEVYKGRIMNLSEYPDWVRRDPIKYGNRLRFEGAQLALLFPNIKIYRRDDTLYLEGPVLTTSGNMYTVRIVYPSNYPHSKPEGFVRDHDVIAFCSISGNSGHSYHNYGSHPDGLKLCLLGNTDNVNKGWTPNQTGITILEYSILWLHAYEYKRKTGKWPLNE